MDSVRQPFREVTIDPHGLKGLLGLPQGARGLVIFAHGSGSGRFSPRNHEVARGLHEAGLATLLLDLLLPEEEADRRNVFDMNLLASRLIEATRWVRRQSELVALPIGLFGASTGGGAALVVAALDSGISAVVSRGGRPDLAGDSLDKVRAPTLLVVGGADTEVLALNRSAASRLTCPYEIIVVPGATHLFEEPGALEMVTEVAQRWFLRWFSSSTQSPEAGKLRFRDRTDAGERLASELAGRNYADPVILALPRGGVPVAYIVAKVLDAPLGIVFVRKIGAPGYPELGIGAIVDGEDPEVFLNEEILAMVKPTAAFVEAETRRQLAEIERRRTLYNAPPIDVRGRTVIVVDDGIATGGTITAVLRAVRKRGAARLVAAVPVAPSSAIEALSSEADEIVCLSTPADFGAVGLYYDDFAQTTNDEVIALLTGAAGFGNSRI